ncbi:hypothetical protein ACIOUE_37805 [Streptomyces xanthochromogenes]|uniref:hypothetical protein n=1 Tax=Streptomyces xanthochromogenes TaxID=67384 RepID=UPI0037F2D7CA
MTTPPRIDEILGSEGAGAFVQQCAADLAHQDHLDPGTALRLACERVADDDPLLIAASGQTWTLYDDVDIDDAPARRLQVHARLTCPPRVLVCDLDDPSGEIDELLLEVLDLYWLTAWTLDPADLGVR